MSHQPRLKYPSAVHHGVNRQFLNTDRQCGVCHGGPMLDITDINTRFDIIGAGLLLGSPEEAFDADGNFVIHPNNPNRNQAFEIKLPDNSSFVAVFPDLGRAAVTGNPDDIAMFKIPTLWGIKDTAPYFHDNSARTLEELMDHYQRFFQFVNAPEEGPFAPLSDQDKADIVAFLKLL